MVRNNKTTLAKLLSLLLTVTLGFTVFTIPVSAEDSDGSPKQKDEKTKLTFLEDVNPDEPEPSEPVVPIYEYGRWNRVHSLPATFEKNFILSPELKAYSIRKYESVVSAILEPEMSDLEKYYTLAIWLNRHVSYDWDFWPAGYDFDYYSHQWDAYGVLKERKSICAGIAIAYANLCHAADLPCKFIRMKPHCLDHTINYIPDINGHAYYIDVTENMLFMSDNANPWDPMDLKFSGIPENQIPDDGSLEYYDGSYHPSEIKAYYNTPFETWFNEYALHKNTKKTFKTKYVEKGSGKAGVHHASYLDFDKYPAQPYVDRASDDVTGTWFLNDFYAEPAEIENKILDNVFDEQLLNISGIKGSYFCTSPDAQTAADELAAAVKDDIAIKYFPSSHKNKVIAEADSLTKDIDYTVSCDPNDINLETGEAAITIAGAGDYREACKIPVKINSAYVEKAPVNHMDLVYNGKPQALVEPGLVELGIAENDAILYAVHKKDGTEDAWKKGQPDTPYPDPKDIYKEELNFTKELPTATDAGKYDVWYMIVGDENHFDLPPQHIDRVAVIHPLKPTIIAKNRTVKVGQKIKLAPTLDIKKAALFDYCSLNEKIVKVSTDSTVTGVATGTAKVSIAGTMKNDDSNYDDPDDIKVTVKVIKGTNPMKLKAKTVTIKRSKIKKKAQTIKRAKLITVSKAQGKLTYKLVSVKKGKKSFKKKFKVNAKTGTVTVKKGLKKGTYKVRIKVKAAGNRNYNPSAWKYVTTKVRVKK